jgi:hypothetical protein
MAANSRSVILQVAFLPFLHHSPLSCPPPHTHTPPLRPPTHQPERVGVLLQGNRCACWAHH